MNPRHALRDLRWWYRRTFKRWNEGPEYADCPNCGGQVYHQWVDIVEYRCHDCTWSQYGTTDFEFYEDQRPSSSTWEMFCTYRELIDEHGPDDPDPEEYADWLENGGIESVNEQLADQYDEDDFREFARDLKRMNANSD